MCLFLFQYDYGSAPKRKTKMCSSPNSGCTSSEYSTMVPGTSKSFWQRFSAIPTGKRSFNESMTYLRIRRSSQILDEKPHSYSVSHPRENGSADVLNDKLILLRHSQRIL